MKSLLITALCLFAASALAQKNSQGFDYFFKPTTAVPRYVVVTEKRETGWYRQAYYLPEKTLAMEGGYTNEACTIPDGVQLWYHPTRFLKSTGKYLGGKKEGVWMEYDEEGRLNDSAVYSNGRLKGIRLKWYADGMLRDSMNFDGAGNGVQVSWFNTGTVSAAGRWTADTAKQGRWVYYAQDGKTLATEDYAAGKLLVCNCFNEAGAAMDTALCREKEARVDPRAWRSFLERNIDLIPSINRGLPNGTYSVMVRFLVEKDGSITDVKALTSFGFGMEEMVVRVIQRGPKWEPGRQFGRPVKSYHTQPVTLMSSGK